ncbi:FAD binding domain-containing protein [Promicromonospora thailandica]|uniref:CO or xanthine dehydrogenase, FAD-binding subunit n=1 Tax=Promicromonospora thailandica TaxID=765201 RepID=A0A9X2G1D6_9MICO|nr:FAD binding domain-containing protein [Promicromonospora thailandica]MCP2264155.1 CO or xanthine dehydrogenase, FAD-binding subunit [Promicromonospora thailandica]BFF21178.1 FAD binding domain-containing protein [Promicromonospora thailandica]
MDLDVDTLRIARTRADCVLRPGEVFLGGGTYLYSEPVPRGVTGLVDLTGLGWEPWSVDGAGLRVAGTCTLAELLAGPGALAGPRPGPGALAPSGAGAAPYRALAIVAPCVSALTLSPKVARTATVGGNLALGLPAGSMAGLFAALGATAVVWTPGAPSVPAAGSREVAVSDLVTGAGTVDLAPGELLREVRVPASALGQRTAFRRMSLTPTGRTSAMVTGRSSSGGTAPGRVLLVLTGSVPAPVLLQLDPGDHAALDRLVDRRIDWFEDAHGSAAWRAAMTRRLAHEVLDELSGAP